MDTWQVYTIQRYVKDKGSIWRGIISNQYFSMLMILVLVEYYEDLGVNIHNSDFYFF